MDVARVVPTKPVQGRATVFSDPLRGWPSAEAGKLGQIFATTLMAQLSGSVENLRRDAASAVTARRSSAATSCLRDASSHC